MIILRGKNNSGDISETKALSCGRAVCCIGATNVVFMIQKDWISGKDGEIKWVF